MSMLDMGQAEPQVQRARQLIAEAETFLSALNERLRSLNGLGVTVRWNVETPNEHRSPSPALEFRAVFPLKR